MPTNIVNSAVNSAKDAAQNTLNSKITEVTSKFSANNLINSNFNDIASKLQDTKSLFGTMTDQDITLGNVSKSLEGIFSDTNKKFTDLANSINGGAGDALSKQLTFLTSGDTLELKNLELPKLDLSKVSGNLSKFQAMTGNLSATVNDLKNSVASKISNAANITNTLTSSITSGVSSITSGIGSTIGSVTGSITGAIGGVTSSLTSKLPQSVQSLINRTVTDPLESIMSQASNIASKVAGGDITSIASTLLSLDKLGPNLFSSKGILADNSLYKLVAQVCPNVSIPDMIDQAFNKNIFDYAITQALALGDSNLLAQLLNCDNYVDNRTLSILKEGIENASIKGDVKSMELIYTTLGKDNISNPTMDIATTIANMNQSNSNITSINGMLTGLGMSSTDLYMTSNNSYDAQNMVFMSNNGTGYLDTVIPPDTKNTTFKVYELYS